MSSVKMQKVSGMNFETETGILIRDIAPFYSTEIRICLVEIYSNTHSIYYVLLS